MMLMMLMMMVVVVVVECHRRRTRRSSEGKEAMITSITLSENHHQDAAWTVLAVLSEHVQAECRRPAMMGMRVSDETTKVAIQPSIHPASRAQPAGDEFLRHIALLQHPFFFGVLSLPDFAEPH
jgi:hypothetical protein